MLRGLADLEEKLQTLENVRIEDDMERKDV